MRYMEHNFSNTGDYTAWCNIGVSGIPVPSSTTILEVPAYTSVSIPYFFPGSVTAITSGTDNTKTTSLTIIEVK